MSKETILAITAIFFIHLNTSQAGDLKFASVFSDHMVLQRDLPLSIWGWSDPGETITVAIEGQSKSCTASMDGKWKVMLDPLQETSKSLNLKASGKDGRMIMARDVLVGEVWLCSGQSNMAMTVDGQTKWLHVGGIANAKNVVRDSANPMIREFAVDWKTDTVPMEDCTGKWRIANPSTTSNFSATGYFFACELQKNLKVPIGILNASFGGSSVEGWTSREALSNGSDAEFVRRMNQLIEDYDHHDQRVSDYLRMLTEWMRKYDRNPPKDGSYVSSWLADDFSPKDWKKVILPSSLEKLGYANGGVVWLRRDIEVPTDFGNAWRLDLPACRAITTLYLNGTKFFEIGPADENRKPSRPLPPRNLARPGKNTLTIKIEGQTGSSGIGAGNFSIVPFNPKYQPVTLKGEWLCKAEKVFSPLPENAKSMPILPIKGTLHWMPVPSQFNAMLHPLINYGIKGVAWYQGESNVGDSRYAQHLKILVHDWRKRWGLGDFPFYSCQLPGFGSPKTQPGDSPWAECREMQMKLLELPNTGIANLIDTCEDGDLHPLNKQSVGKRLAMVALANTYGFKELAWSGPVFDSMSINGDKAILSFRHIGKGLKIRALPATYHPNLRKPELESKKLDLPSPGSDLQGFIICDASRNWVNALAKIESNKVIVWSPEVKNPVAVRYAWANHPVCNLDNQAGLPAFPFRTDSFSREPNIPLK